MYTIVKYILALYHSLLLSYVCWFGGKMEGKTLYLLWTIVIRDDKHFTIDDCDITQLTNRKYMFKAVNPLGCISNCTFTTYQALKRD